MSALDLGDVAQADPRLCRILRAGSAVLHATRTQDITKLATKKHHAESSRCRAVWVEATLPEHRSFPAGTPVCAYIGEFGTQ